MNCTYADMKEFYIMAYVNSSFSFFMLAYYI